jgi:nicotinate-nucleotide pyrophosphorylase (carboxylating)
MEPAIKAWLAEDIGSGDVTTAATVEHSLVGRAHIEARQVAVIAGLDVAAWCLELAGDQPITWQPLLRDGDEATAGQVLAKIEGSLAQILTGERTVLNLLGRMSGIATMTSSFVKAVEGTKARILDTRKTTPGLRALERYAVREGGGTNHRWGLSDAVLIKDNHVVAAGGVKAAVARAQAAAGDGLQIEVEVTTLEELDEALEAGPDIVLLDNMTPEMVKQAVGRAQGRTLLEVSGGVNLENVRSYALTGVDRISIGALTHSVRAVDLSLEIDS